VVLQILTLILWCLHAAYWMCWIVCYGFTLDTGVSPMCFRCMVKVIQKRLILIVE
jgi:hypothetical protein